MPRSYQFEKHPNNSQNLELKPLENKMFESTPYFKNNMKVTPFNEYSNASKMMKSSTQKADVDLKSVSNKNSHYESNISNFDHQNSNHCLVNFNVNNNNNNQNKHKRLLNCETNMDINSFDSPRIHSKYLNRKRKECSSPIEETKYATLKQVTNASINEKDDYQNNNFYEDNEENPNLIKTIEEAESFDNDKKENENTFSEDQSLTHSQVENKLFEKITDKIDEKEIDSEKQISFIKDDIEKKGDKLTLSQQELKQLRKDRTNPHKKDLSATYKTETGGTPLLVKEVQQVEEDKNEMYFSDKLITIEEANHRNENDFIFEKSLFESNELIDNIDISKPIDEQVKLKKLRSRKLRRRKKATKLKNQIKSNIIMKGINFIQRPTPIARGPPESHAKIPLNACGNWW